MLVQCTFHLFIENFFFFAIVHKDKMNVVIGPGGSMTVAEQNNYSTSAHKGVLYRKMSKCQPQVFATVRALLKTLSENKDALNNLIKIEQPQEACLVHGAVRIQHIDANSADASLNDGCLSYNGEFYKNRRRARTTSVCPTRLAYLPPGTESIVSRLVPAAWYDIEILTDMGTEVWACKYVEADDEYTKFGLIKVYKLQQREIEQGTSRLADTAYTFLSEYQNADTDKLVKVTPGVNAITGYKIDFEASSESVVSLDAVLEKNGEAFLNIRSDVLHVLDDEQSYIGLKDVRQFRGPMILNLNKHMKNGKRSCNVEDYSDADYALARDQVLRFPCAVSVLQEYNNIPKEDTAVIDFSVLQSRFLCDSDTAIQYTTSGKVKVSKVKRIVHPDIGLCGYYCRLIQPRFRAFETVGVYTDITNSRSNESVFVTASTLFRRAAQTDHFPDVATTQYRVRHEEDALATVNQILKVYSRDIHVERNFQDFNVKFNINSSTQEYVIGAAPSGFVLNSNNQIIGIVETNCNLSISSLKHIPLEYQVQCYVQFYVMKEVLKVSGLDYLEWVYFVSWTKSECAIHKHKVENILQFASQLEAAIIAIQNNVIFFDFNGLMDKTTVSLHASMFRKNTESQHNHKYIISMKHVLAKTAVEFDSETATIKFMGKVYDNIKASEGNPYDEPQMWWLHRVWRVMRTDNDNALDDPNLTQVLTKEKYKIRDIDKERLICLSDEDIKFLFNARYQVYKVVIMIGDSEVKFNAIPLMYKFEKERNDNDSSWYTCNDRYTMNAPVLQFSDGVVSMYAINMETPYLIERLNDVYFSGANCDWESTPAFAIRDNVQIHSSDSLNEITIVNHTTTLVYKFMGQHSHGEFSVLSITPLENKRYSVKCTESLEFECGNILGDVVDIETRFPDTPNRRGFENFLINFLNKSKADSSELCAVVAKRTIRYFIGDSDVRMETATNVAYEVLEKIASHPNSRRLLTLGDTFTISVPSFAYKWTETEPSQTITNDTVIGTKLLSHEASPDANSEIKVVDPKLLPAMTHLTKDTVVKIGNQEYKSKITTNFLNQFVVNHNRKKRFVHIQGDEKTLLSQIEVNGTISATVKSIQKLANGTETVTFFVDTERDSLGYSFTNPHQSFSLPGLPDALKFCMKMFHLANSYADDHFINKISVNLSTKAETESVWKLALTYALYISQNTSNTAERIFTSDSRKVRNALKNLNTLDPLEVVTRLEEVQLYHI